MKNKADLTLRVFPILGINNRTGNEETITVIVTKQQLQAAQIVGQSSKELIGRFCERQGYTVVEIGSPDKLSVTLDLDKLVEEAGT